MIILKHLHYPDLLLVLKITIAKKKLEEHEFLNNILILDYYKYIVFMVISFLFLALIYYIIYCFCMILKCICESCESKATKVDDKGNVYDQFGNFMAHYSKRPVAVDSEGNVTENENGLNGYFVFKDGKEEKIEYADEAEYQKSVPLMKLQLKALIARDLWDMSEYYQVINESNESVQKALELLKEKDFEKLLLKKNR